ncbi:MAG: hypothetical protein HY320_04630 [Armatimonadetes bacterium]|nr:hypothetical protein [Armatimonadota bacterium]
MADTERIGPRFPIGDMPEEEFRRLGYAAVDLMTEYLAGIRDRPAWQPVPDDVGASLIEEPVPEAGDAVDKLLDDFRRRILPYPYGNGHPRWWGYVAPSPTPVGILGQALATAIDANAWGGNQAATYVEMGVLDWLKDLLGYPRESGGLLVSGGSEANLTALAIARGGAGWDVRRRGLTVPEARPLTVYASREVHSSIPKALELLGLGTESLRQVEVDEGYRMDVADLERRVAEDRAAGYLPLAVVASAGTVNTGAIDPLDRIAAVARRERLWFHVDGAYGGFAALSPALRARFAGMEQADSLVVDPHKWLYVPFAAGCVLVRDAAAMERTFATTPAYLHLPPDSPYAGPAFFSDRGLQLSREFQALKIWFSLRHHGRQAYAAAIEHDVQMAQHLSGLVEEAPDFELLAPVELSIVCFRYVPADLRVISEREDVRSYLNALNERILSALQWDGTAFLSGTQLRGRTALRACILNFRSALEDARIMLDEVREIGLRMDHTDVRAEFGLGAAAKAA